MLAWLSFDNYANHFMKFLYSILICSTILLLNYCSLFGQDSTQKVEKKLPLKLNYALNWDGRSSFIDDKPVNIWGINTGISVGKKQHEMTIGYYWLTTNSVSRLIDLRKSAAKRLNLDYYTKTDLFYFSTMYWHNFIETKRWRLSVPIEIGIGSTRSEQNNLRYDYQLWKRKDFFVPIQTGVYFKWKTTRWFGLSAQIGYRMSLIQRNIKDRFDGIYYSYGVGLNPVIITDLYNLMMRKKKKRMSVQTSSQNQN